MKSVPRRVFGVKGEAGEFFSKFAIFFISARTNRSLASVTMASVQLNQSAIMVRAFISISVSKNRKSALKLVR